jgi:hypothetical protein
MLVAHPRFLANPTVGDILARLALLEARRTELLALRRPESTEARTLDAQIAQLGEALEALATEYRTALAETVDELEGRVRGLERILQGLPADAVELGRRQRALRILSEVLVLSEQRLRQEELRQALAFSNVQVVDPPRLRWRPVWPRKKLGLAVATVLAFGTGLFTTVVAERADPSVRTAERVRALADAPVLASPTGALSEREVAAVRTATGGACVVVPCAGAERDAPAVASDLAAAVRVVGPDEVDAFAAAAAVARREAPVLLVVRAGVTPEHEMVKVAGLVREAGATVAGVVAACATDRDRRLFWT